jgi:hypothetical protein
MNSLFEGHHQHAVTGRRVFLLIFAPDHFSSRKRVERGKWAGVAEARFVHLYGREELEDGLICGRRGVVICQTGVAQESPGGVNTICNAVWVIALARLDRKSFAASAQDVALGITAERLFPQLRPSR